MTVIAGRYAYAPKLYIDYLSARMPGVFIATRIPTDAVRGGRPLVVIDTIPAGGMPGNAALVLARRWLVFSCFDTDETGAAELCEWIRAEVLLSRYAHLCRAATVNGEPARFDRPDEPIPRFQTTIEVVLRENYRHLTVVN